MNHEQTSDPSTAHPSGCASGHAVPPVTHYDGVASSTTNDNSSSGSERGSPHSKSTEERRLVHLTEGHFMANQDADLERGSVPPPPPARSRDSAHVRVSMRRPTSGHRPDSSYLDHVVPTTTPRSHRSLSQHSPDMDEKKGETAGRFTWLIELLSCYKRPKGFKYPEHEWECGTLGARLAPTIKYAESEREKYAKKALALGWALNFAIGLQILLGAMTTALAAAITSARQAQVSTAVLGGLSTLVASYLARVRGSGEPELSIIRVKDLDHFLRDCRGFELDHGHDITANHHHCPVNKRLLELRQKLEDLLGNASGERKLSATGVGPTGTTAGATQTGTAAPAR